MRKFFIFLSLLSYGSLCLAHDFKFERFKTPNGMNVVFYKTMSVPMLDLRLAFKAGSAYDENQFGVSALTTKLLNQGNAGLNANQIAEQLDSTGAQYSAEASRDFVLLSFRTLTEQAPLKTSLEIFKNIVTKPDFTQDAFNHEKSQLLVSIQQINESPDDLANEAFFKSLYGTHPYGHPTLGTTQTVTALKPIDVQSFYKRYYVAKNATLVMVGAIELEKAKEIAISLSKDLQPGSEALDPPKAQNLNDHEQVIIKYPASQTVIRIGQLGINHDTPHYFPLIVGNYILGGGALESILFREVREKRGLTYGVYSELSPLNGKGPFVISLSTKNQSVNEAKNVTLTTLKTYVEKGPSKDELAAAKRYLKGSFPLSLASNADIANTLLRVSFYHLPEDYLERYVQEIENVSIDSIKTAFAELIRIQDILEVQVGTV